MGGNGGDEDNIPLSPVNVTWVCQRGKNWWTNLIQFSCHAFDLLEVREKKMKKKIASTPLSVMMIEL